MRTLKKMISRYMRRITFVLLAIILVFVVYIQLINEQRRAYESATRTIAQIEQLLVLNQVELKKENVEGTAQNDELSYMFSLLRVNPEVDYYAISNTDKNVVGTTAMDCLGKRCDDIGFNIEELVTDKDGFHQRINGQYSFCVFEKIGDNYIGRVINAKDLYQRVPNTIFVFGVCFAFIAFALAYTVVRYMNKYVVEEIYSVNKKLGIIAGGNLDERVDVQSTEEFSQLSSYINMMKNSILDSNKKMSYVLSKTNMFIGVYEYNQCMQKVRCTEYIPKILYIEKDDVERISSDYRIFQQFINNILKNPLDGEKGVYRLNTTAERYVRIEEIKENGEVFGVVIDVTPEIMKRKQIEVERDIDSLTGLYNRRGLDLKLSILFSEPYRMKNSALVVIDADGLKGINDTYGHELGDVYLKKIASIIINFGIKKSLAARYGGDEFVLFLYEYDDEDELLNTIKTIQYIQNNSSARLSEKLNVPLRFSFGYSVVGDRDDYHEVFKEADAKMYENKRQRKNDK